MNCFVHDRSAAIGICSVCQKAVCRECIALDTPRLVCRTCIQQRAVMGFEYRSRLAVGGWPLIHVCMGVDPITMRPRVVRGLLFALGGAAVGLGLSIGGFAIGSVAIGGAAVGIVHAMGGAAFGPSIIDGRRCDPAAVDFVRRWFGSGILPPNCP